MGKADLHIHSTYSRDGTATVAAILTHVKRNTDLDVIAITDHDTIYGALEALELAPRYGLEVVPGIEVSTADGHLLALFVTEVVPRDMSLLDTVICVAEMGGICIGAHPGGRWYGCLSEAALRTALLDNEVSDTLLALEGYNASLLRLQDNVRAVEMAASLQLGLVGNSDAHVLYMIGRGATQFPGANANALRLALENGWTKTIATSRPWYYPASYLKSRLLRQFGLAHDTNAAPGSPINLERYKPLAPKDVR